MSILESAVNRILDTKSELEFAEVVFSENIPQREWEKNDSVKAHFDKIRKNGPAYLENIGYLTKE